MIAYTGGQLVREGQFQFMTSFSLPWYAVVGAEKGVTVGLPVFGCLLLAVVGPTAGPLLHRHHEWGAAEAVHPSRMVRRHRSAHRARLDPRHLGRRRPLVDDGNLVRRFTVRVIALYRAWEEPLAKEPAGAYQHADGRPLRGRKLAGKSQCELRDLGLVIEDGRIVEEAGQPG